MCAPYVEARPKGGARAEKEIGEKAQKIIRYQIVSTYFLHGAFKVLFSAWRPVFSRLLVWQCVHPCYPWTPWRPVYIICYAGTKKKVGEPSGSSVPQWFFWLIYELKKAEGPNINIYRTPVLPSLWDKHLIFPSLICIKHEFSNNLVRHFQSSPTISVIGH